MRSTALSLRRPARFRDLLLVALAVLASLAIAALGLLANLSLLAVTASAGTVERYVVEGSNLDVCNLAGTVRVVAGTGPATEVFLTRGGRDGARLRVTRGEHGGVTRLHVVYPGGWIVYPALRGHGRTTLSVGSDGCLASGHGLFGRRVTITGAGHGVEAWADLEIRVPRGGEYAIRLGAGRLEARGVDGQLTLDIGNGPVAAEATRGRLSVDTGSGSVTLGGHEGELLVDTGSGGIDLRDVRGPRLHLDTGSGGVEGTGVAVDDIYVDTGSGGVGLDGVRSKSIRVDTGSGSVRLALEASPLDVKIDTGSGGVEIVAPEDLDAQVDLDSGSGGIETDFAMRSMHAEHGEMHGTVGDGRGRIAVDVGSGGVKLRRR